MKKTRKKTGKRFFFVILICFLAAVFVVGFISFGISSYKKYQHKKSLFDDYNFLKDMVLEKRYTAALDLAIELEEELKDERDHDLVNLYQDVRRIKLIILEEWGGFKEPRPKIEEKAINLNEELIGEIEVSEPSQLAFSPDGSKLYAVKGRYSDAKVYVIDVNSASAKNAFLTDRLSWIKVSSDGNSLLGAVHCDEQPGYGYPRMVAYSLPYGKEILNEVTGISDPSFLMGGTASHDGEYIFAGTKGTNELIRVRVSDGKRQVYPINFPPFDEHCRQPYCSSVPWAGADITKDDSKVYFLVRTQTDSMDYVVEMDADKWRYINHWKIGKSTADAGLLLSPDEKSVYIFQNDKNIKKLDLKTGQIEYIYSIGGWMAARIGQTPYLVTDKGKVIDTETDNIIHEIESVPLSGYVATSSDGKIAFSDRENNKVYIFELGVQK